MTHFYFHSTSHRTLLKTLMAAMVLIGSTTNAFSQSSFSKRVKVIDSIATQIDSDKTFTIAVSEGSSENDTGFSFCFYTYYKKDSKMVLKSKYSCFSPATTFKTFYYNNNKLIKIVSDGNSFYYVQNVLYLIKGIAASKAVSDELLELSKMPLQDMEQYFRRMRK